MNKSFTNFESYPTQINQFNYSFLKFIALKLNKERQDCNQNCGLYNSLEEFAPNVNCFVIPLDNNGNGFSFFNVIFCNEFIREGLGEDRVDLNSEFLASLSMMNTFWRTSISPILKMNFP
jgi:hypothetical protein